jgi:hypothetical protein
MGWNSFDGFGVYLHEAAAWDCLRAMHQTLQPHGYHYFVVDGGWHGEIKRHPGTIYPAERHASTLNLDRFGLPEPSRSAFPRGLVPLINETHRLGMKFGLHLMRGIARQTLQQDYRSRRGEMLRDITLTERGCKWCPQNVGVDVSKPAGRRFYRDLILKLADWGVDFVKFDDITAFPDEIDAVMDAVESLAPHLVVSLSPGGDTDMTYAATYDRADLLRVTPDIWDDQKSIDRGFEIMVRSLDAPLHRCHIDLDMIPFGKLMQMTPADAAANGQESTAFAGKGQARRSQFTPAQARTFMFQRAVSGSPLIVGGDPSTYLRHEMDLLSDADVVACNQLGKRRQLNVIVDDADLMTVGVRASTSPGLRWMAVFNRSASESRRIPLGYSADGVPRWALSSSSDSTTLLNDPAASTTWIDVPPGDAAFLKPVLR